MYEDRKHRGKQPLYLGVPNVWNLPPGYNILTASLIIDATVTISGSTAAGTAVGEGGAYNLIRRVLVNANPGVPNANGTSRYRGGELVNLSIRSLLRYAVNQRSGKFYGALLGDPTLGNGVNGVYPIYLSIPIFFQDTNLINGINGMQTSLNLNMQDSQGRPVYSQVQLVAEIADTIAELFAGNNGAVTIAGTIEFKDDRVDLGSSGVDSLELYQEDHETLIQAASDEFIDGAMPNDGLFLTWLLMAEQGSAHVLSDAILERMEISSPTLGFKESWKAIRQSMIDSAFYDPSTNMAGQFFLDWTKGYLQNSNAAAGMQTQMGVNNPSGTGLDRFRTYTRRVKPLLS